MKIQNIRERSLEEVKAALDEKYPGCTIKKPFLTPRTVVVPYENFKFFVRDRKTFLHVDFSPPVLWIVAGILLSFILASTVWTIVNGQLSLGFGGALWIILGIVIAKAIFKSANKPKFEAFYADAQEAVYKTGDSAIF